MRFALSHRAKPPRSGEQDYPTKIRAISRYGHHPFPPETRWSTALLLSRSRMNSLRGSSALPFLPDVTGEAVLLNSFEILVCAWSVRALLLTLQLLCAPHHPVLSENSNEINRHDSGLACNAEMAFSE